MDREHEIEPRISPGRFHLITGYRAVLPQALRTLPTCFPWRRRRDPDAVARRAALRLQAFAGAEHLLQPGRLVAAKDQWNPGVPVGEHLLPERALVQERRPGFHLDPAARAGERIRCDLRLHRPRDGSRKMAAAAHARGRVLGVAFAAARTDPHGRPCRARRDQRGGRGIDEVHAAFAAVPAGQRVHHSASVAKDRLVHGGSVRQMDFRGYAAPFLPRTRPPETLFHPHAPQGWRRGTELRTC